MLDDELPTLTIVEIHKQGGTKLGCTLLGKPLEMASVSNVVPGSLVADALRVGDMIVRVDGEVAADVQIAHRLLGAASGTVRLQVHRRPLLIETSESARKVGADAVQATLRQRAAPWPPESSHGAQFTSSS